MRTKRGTVLKTKRPRDPGTRRRFERRSEELLCVRCRHDDERRDSLTAAEIIIDRDARQPHLRTPTDSEKRRARPAGRPPR